MKDFTIEFRGFGELDEYKGRKVMEGDRAYVSRCYRKTLLANPFRQSDAVPCQKVGFVDDRIAGTEIQLPLMMNIDGREVLAGSGSDTNVDEWARSSGLGLAISDDDGICEEYSPVISEGAGLSQIAVKVHRFIGYTVFEYPRLIMLLKSRSVVEMKLKGFLRFAVTQILDSFIWIYSRLVLGVSWFCARGVTALAVDPDDADALRMLGGFVALDKRRFSEVHDERWFGWVLANSFSEQGPAIAYIVRKFGKPIGFFMVKKRFHEQASHRGFRNVNLGSVVEWGCLPDHESKLLWSIVQWALHSRYELDAVEFAVAEPHVQRFFRRLGWLHVGDVNFCYHVRPNSSFKEPEGMRNSANWRLRAGMGDCALN